MQTSISRSSLRMRRMHKCQYLTFESPLTDFWLSNHLLVEVFGPGRKSQYNGIKQFPHFTSASHDLRSSPAGLTADEPIRTALQRTTVAQIQISSGIVPSRVRRWMTLTQFRHMSNRKRKFKLINSISENTEVLTHVNGWVPTVYINSACFACRTYWF